MPHISQNCCLVSLSVSFLDQLNLDPWIYNFVQFVASVCITQDFVHMIHRWIEMHSVVNRYTWLNKPTDHSNQPISAATMWSKFMLISILQNTKNFTDLFSKSNAGTRYFFVFTQNKIIVWIYYILIEEEINETVQNA